MFVLIYLILSEREIEAVSVNCVSVSQMIFLSRIVPITGVAQPGKNLPPTKTSEPGLGWGSHILLGLTNRERELGARGRSSSKLFILLLSASTPADPLRSLRQFAIQRRISGKTSSNFM